MLHIITCLMLLALPGAAPDDVAAGEDSRFMPELPGITIDRDAGYIDIDAEVADRGDDWVELIACVKGTRDYEAVVVTEARPSHVHLALLTLELEPGKPMSWHKAEQGDDFVTEPATGPVLEVFYVMTDEEGNETEIPANAWVWNKQTGEVMDTNRWLFTGSRIMQQGEEHVYLADVNGTVVSVVNFGDDLLVRATDLTNQSDGGQWQAKADNIPPAGTALRLRLRPVPPEPLSDEPAP